MNPAFLNHENALFTAMGQADNTIGIKRYQIIRQFLQYIPE